MDDLSQSQSVIPRGSSSASMDLYSGQEYTENPPTIMDVDDAISAGNSEQRDDHDGDDESDNPFASPPQTGS